MRRFSFYTLFFPSSSSTSSFSSSLLLPIQCRHYAKTMCFKAICLVIHHFSLVLLFSTFLPAKLFHFKFAFAIRFFLYAPRKRHSERNELRRRGIEIKGVWESQSLNTSHHSCNEWNVQPLPMGTVTRSQRCYKIYEYIFRDLSIEFLFRMSNVW